MKRYIFSGLFVMAGVVLLIVPHNLSIRGVNANFGWLVLGIGVVSLILDFAKGIRKQEAAPAPSTSLGAGAAAKSNEPPPPTSPPVPPVSPNP